MAIVNNTYCELRYNLGGSLNSPCGEAVYVHGSIPPQTTIRWPGPEAVDWNRNATQIYWRSFSMDYEGANVTGRCTGLPAYSPVIYLPECKTDISYHWENDAAGNVVVTITAVSLRIPPNVSRNIWRFPPKGGTAVIINPMLEAEADGNLLIVKTNQGFLAGGYTRHGKAATGVIITPAGQFTGNAACRRISLGPAVQQVITGCFCGMEQVFNLRETGGGNEKTIFTVTQL